MSQKQARYAVWVLATLLWISGGVAFGEDANVPSTTEATTPAGQLQVCKVLFLGNSITLHAPAPHIGWTGNWGMAASALEKDYVHLLMEQISQSTETQPESMARNIADFERQHGDYQLQEGLKEELAFEADRVMTN